MKLFGEKVVNSFTNSTYNILQVENFSEIFFDVYEVELNNGKFPVEKVAEYKGNPIVMLPIIVEGQERLYPFVLANGKRSIIFHEKNTEIPVDDHIPEIITEEIEVEHLQESKQEILKQISEAKENAMKIAAKLKRKKLQEANEEISHKKKILDNTLEKAKNALVEEFFKVSNNIKNELISENDNRFDEIKVTIDNKIEYLSGNLKDSLNEDFSKSSEVFDKTIKELVKESYIALQPKIDEELKNIATEIVEKVDSIEKNLEEKLSDKADKVLIENVEGELNSIALANIELNDKINKGVNKALSRVGNISTKVDELTIALAEEVDTKISKAEENIEQYYSEKLSMLEGKTFDLTENVRKSLVELISESKDNLIQEIRKIQNEKPIEYVIESNGKRQVKDFDSFEKDYDKKIKDRVDNEVTRLRKYISVYSGGGSVAMQFADGGTMNGNLIVNGNITSFNLSGTNTGDQDLSGLVPYIGATGNVNLGNYTLSANRIFTTQLDALSANITVIDIKQYELSGFNVTGDVLVDGELTIVGNISSTGYVTASGLYTPYVQFDTLSNQIANAEGLLQWNATDGTLDLGMDGGAITQQLGQELFTKVRNESGYQTIPNGSAVYISGRTGVFPTVRLAKSNLDSTSRVLGVATQNITSPDWGFITTVGYVRGIKTDYTGTGIWGNTWVTGDMLYVSKSDAGVLTNVEPSTPHHSDLVGSVGVISSNQGTILVGIDRHKTLEEMSDVNGTALTTTGQFPSWNQTEGYFDFDKNINDYALSSSLSAYVPYTGATTDVDLGANDLNANLLSITKASEAGVRERLFTATISDASRDSFFINNGTIVDGRFAPVFGGIVDTTNTTWGLGFAGFASSVNDASDSSSYGLVDIMGSRTTSAPDPLNGTLSNVVNRKLFTIRNLSDVLMTMMPTGEMRVSTADVNNIQGLLTISSGDTTVSAAQTIGSLRYFHKDASVTSSEIASIRAISEATISSTATVNGSLAFFTTLNNTPTEAIRILSTGSVGIGTTSPLNKLSVTGAANITNGLFLGDATAAGGGDAVYNNGFITLTSPADYGGSTGRETLLYASVAGSAGSFAIQNTTTTSNQFAPRFSGAASDSAFAALTFSGNVEGFDTGTAEALSFQIRNDVSAVTSSRGIAFKNFATYLMNILPNGSVGIGTTTPSSKLDVNGTANFAGNVTMLGTANVTGNFKVNTNTLYVDSLNNKVGIGTLTPTEKLTVSGNISASGLFTAYAEKSTNYTVLPTDSTINCLSAMTVQLPTAVGITGRNLIIKNSGTGTVTLSAFQTQTIDGVNTVDLLQYDSLTIQSTNTNWIIL